MLMEMMLMLIFQVIAAMECFPPPVDLSHEGGEYEVFEGLIDEISQAS